MSEDDPKVKKSHAAPKQLTESSLTPETIEQLLRDAVPGAQELDQNLKRVFDLSEANASLRLK